MVDLMFGGCLQGCFACIICSSDFNSFRLKSQKILGVRRKPPIGNWDCIRRTPVRRLRPIISSE